MLGEHSNNPMPTFSTCVQCSPSSSSFHRSLKNYHITYCLKRLVFSIYDSTYISWRMILEPLGRKCSRRKLSLLPQLWSAYTSFPSLPLHSKSGFFPWFFWGRDDPRLPALCRPLVNIVEWMNATRKLPLVSTLVKLWSNSQCIAWDYETHSHNSCEWLTPSCLSTCPWILDADFKSTLPPCPRHVSVY